MKNKLNVFDKLRLGLVGLIVFLFPLFFLTITQSFFVTNKLYLIAFGAFTLLTISLAEFIFSRKIEWQKTSFDTPLMLFLIGVVLALVVTATNKVQALLNPNFGPIAIFSLIVLYYYMVKVKRSLPLFKILSFSSLILAIITIVSFFQPFKSVNLPASWQFLKSPFFTPAGNLINLSLFLSFVGLWQIVNLVSKKKEGTTMQNLSHHLFTVVGLILNLVGLLLALYIIIHPQAVVKNGPATIIITPWRLSWYAAVEILKNPLNALFGIGIGNFTTIFTRVKDFAYNQSPLWQTNTFSVSRSALLHILTASGLFGLISFLFLLLKAKHVAVDKYKTLFAYLVLAVLIAPPSLVLFFIFFFGLAQISTDLNEPYSLNLARVVPVYAGITLIGLAFVGGGFYFLGRSYLAEYTFNRAIVNLQNKKLKDGYQDMKQTIFLNPYQEKYRFTFSQLNLAIANNLASKKKDKITDRDKQNISQAIQTAIAEAKAAVTLNPKKASNWANLANLYRQILGFAKGADAWSISAFQRAIILDPQNLNYRVNLGGLLYSLKNYSQAGQVFSQAVAIKPNWANTHYNLAWTYYQQKKYQQAAAEMQNALSLLDPKRNKADYDRAQKDLNKFKEMLPKKEVPSAQKGAVKQQPPQLKLPSPPPTKLKEKLKLPKEASPEAK